MDTMSDMITQNIKHLNFYTMALNRVKGIISHMGEIQQGTSQNGYDWARQIIVLDVASFNGTFSKIALTAQNQRVDELADFQIGDRVEVGYSVTAREWDGKWFNNVDLVSINFLEEAAPASVPAPQTARPAQRQVAPAAPAAQQRRVARPARTSPLVPPGANLEPQDDDLPC